MTSTPALPATLITGAADRVGRAMATDLALSGTPVCIHYNSSAAKAHALAKDLAQRGATVATVQANMMDDEAVATLIARGSQALGQPLQCLVNSASMFKADEVGSLSADLFHKHFAIHATASAVLADALVNQLPEGAEGLIVNIIDQRVWRLTPNFVSYTASKVALWGLTQTLAQAYAGSTGGKVRVNAIGPGPTLANERQDPADFQKQVDGVLLRRGPDLSDFAQTIRYMWDMKSLTGQMVALDGGQHLAWETPDVADIKE